MNGFCVNGDGLDPGRFRRTSAPTSGPAATMPAPNAQNAESEPELPSFRVGISCAAPAVLLAPCVLLPFLQKAYTNDDVTFLLQAKHVMVDPLHPTAFEMVFHGDRMRLSQELV